MSDILLYIIEHPFFSLILLGIVVLFGLAPFSSSSTENKLFRQLLISTITILLRSKKD